MATTPIELGLGKGVGTQAREIILWAVLATIVILLLTGQGLYEIKPSGDSPWIWKINRFTGAVTFCAAVSPNHATGQDYNPRCIEVP